MRRRLVGLTLVGLAACTPPLSPATLPPIRGHVAKADWHALATAQDLAFGTVSLIQPANGLTVAAGNSRGDGSFVLFLPPTLRPGQGSTWFLDVVRRVRGHAVSLRTVVSWDGDHWLSCTNGAGAGAELSVTTATTAAARVVERAGLPLAAAIGKVQGRQIGLGTPIEAEWPQALRSELEQAMQAGRDPLSVSPAVVVRRMPDVPSGGDLVSWLGYGFGTVTGTVTVGGRTLPVRLWQDRQIQAGIPAGLPPAAVTLTLANGEQVTTAALQVPESWRAMPPLRTPRGGDCLAAGAIGTTAYVAGGQDGAYEPIAALEILTAQGRTTGAPMPTPRYGLGGAVLNGRFFAVGGMAGGAVATAVEAYDPGADAWAPSTSLPVALYQPAVAADGSNLYVCGGDTGTVLSDVIYRWNGASSSWQAGSARLTPARVGAAAVALPDGRILITGGRNGAGQALADCEVYDPAADTLVEAPPLAVARYAHAAGLAGGGVIVAGGWQDDFGSLAAVEAWATGQAEWRPGTSLPAARFGATAVAVGPTFWLLAGANDGEGSGADVWEYQP